MKTDLSGTKGNLSGTTRSGDEHRIEVFHINVLNCSLHGASLWFVRGKKFFASYKVRGCKKPATA
jgi:hypothetical protein